MVQADLSSLLSLLPSSSIVVVVAAAAAVVVVLKGMTTLKHTSKQNWSSRTRMSVHIYNTTAEAADY